VVVAGAVVFVIEFKVGEKHFTRADLDQVWDYALDLKNFHEASHAVPILPILVATQAVAGARAMLCQARELIRQRRFPACRVRHSLGDGGSALVSAFRAGETDGGYPRSTGPPLRKAESAFPALHVAGAEFTRRSALTKAGQFRRASP
jgi:hypothetical protein